MSHEHTGAIRRFIRLLCAFSCLFYREGGNRVTATQCGECSYILGELQIVDQLVSTEDRIGGYRAEGAADVNALLIFHDSTSFQINELTDMDGIKIAGCIPWENIQLYPVLVGIV